MPSLSEVLLYLFVVLFPIWVIYGILDIEAGGNPDKSKRIQNLFIAIGAVAGFALGRFLEPENAITAVLFSIPGFLVGGVLGVIIGAFTVDTPSQTSNVFGDARWADKAKDALSLGELLPPPGRVKTDQGILFGLLHPPWKEIESGRDEWPWLKYTGPSHVMTIAPTRSGKGTCAIIPNLLTLPTSVLVIDPKGENAAITQRQRRTFGDVYFLNPFGLHGLERHQFNPLAHLSKDQDALYAETSNIAEALIIDEGGGQNKYFPDTARVIVRLILLYLVSEKGNKATLIDMRKALTQPEEDFGLMIKKMMESPIDIISETASQFEKNTKSLQEVLSTARTQTSFLSDRAISHTLSGNDFSIIDLKKKPTTIYVMLPSRFLDVHSRFLRLIVVSAIDQLQSQTGGTRTTIILDEFPALKRLSSIETAFGQAAGFGVQLWPILQDLNQLKAIYGDRWQSFLANCGVVQWFTPADMFTAEYLSRRLGQTTVRTNSGSTSTRDSGGTSETTSYGETGQPFQSPTNLLGLAPMFSILTTSGLQHGVRAVRLPYFDDGKRVDDAQWRRFNAVILDYQSQFSGKYDRNPFR